MPESHTIPRSLPDQQNGVTVFPREIKKIETLSSFLGRSLPKNISKGNTHYIKYFIVFVTVFYFQNLAFINCPVFETAYIKLFVSESPSMVEKYGSLLELLTEVTGYNVTSMPGYVYGIYDVYTSQVCNSTMSSLVMRLTLKVVFLCILK